MVNIWNLKLHSAYKKIQSAVIISEINTTKCKSVEARLLHNEDFCEAVGEFC